MISDLELWRLRLAVMVARAKVARQEARLWAMCRRPSGEASFCRGLAVGVAVALLSVVAAGVIRGRQAGVHPDDRLELARVDGYSACCIDVMSIVWHGGGIEEVISFARAKGETGFSPLVSPTNFYPSADSAMVGVSRRVGLASNWR